jgi:hypothetical protein
LLPSFSAIIYLGFFVVSVAYWIFETLRQKAAAALSGRSSANSNNTPTSTRKKFGNKYGALEGDEEH